MTLPSSHMTLRVGDDSSLLSTDGVPEVQSLSLTTVDQLARRSIGESRSSVDSGHQDPQYRLQVTEVSKSPVVLYNQYMPGKARYFDVKGQKQDFLQAVFHEIKSEAMPDGGTNFTINFSKRIAKYQDSSGVERYVDLEKLMLEKPDLKKLIDQAEELISKEIYKGDIHSYNFSSTHPGIIDGCAPLSRSNDILKGLPKSTGREAYRRAMSLSGETDQGKCDLAMKRMGAAEKIIARMKKKIEDKIAALQTQSSNAPPPSNIHEIRQSLNQLKESREKLEQVDTFALYSALAFYPDDTGDVSSQAKELCRKVEQFTQGLREQAIRDGVARPWIPNWPLIGRFRGEKDVTHSRFYPVEVGGLMFSGLHTPEGRLGYSAYCKNNNVLMRGEGLEGALMRQILQPDSPNPGLNGFFSHITDLTLRGELEGERDGAIRDAKALLQQPIFLTKTDRNERIDEFRTQVGLTT